MITHEEKIFLAKLGTACTGITITAVASTIGGSNGWLNSGMETDSEQAAIVEEVELSGYEYENEDFEIVYDENGNPFIYSYEMLPSIEPIIDVELPEKLSFSIDPYEINGKGQVFSDNYSIRNYSNVDVIVNIKTINYVFKNNTDFISLDAPYDFNNPTDFKAIHMLLCSEAPDFNDVLIRDEITYDAAQIYLKASVYEDNSWICFSEGSETSVYITGTANESPAVAWENNDVILEVSYEVEPVLPPPVMTAVLVPYIPEEHGHNQGSGLNDDPDAELENALGDEIESPENVSVGDEEGLKIDESGDSEDYDEVFSDSDSEEKDGDNTAAVPADENLDNKHNQPEGSENEMPGVSEDSNKTNAAEETSDELLDEAAYETVSDTGSEQSEQSETHESDASEQDNEGDAAKTITNSSIYSDNSENAVDFANTINTTETGAATETGASTETGFPTTEDTSKIAQENTKSTAENAGKE